jgi:hypothetical protein
MNLIIDEDNFSELSNYTFDIVIKEGRNFKCYSGKMNEIIEIVKKNLNLKCNGYENVRFAAGDFPIFKGLIGPMGNGPNSIRYENEEAYYFCSN